MLNKKVNKERRIKDYNEDHKAAWNLLQNLQQLRRENSLKETWFAQSLWKSKERKKNKAKNKEKSLNEEQTRPN